MKYRTLQLALALFVLSFAVYAPIARNSFINLDDDKYIYANQQIRRGLNAETARWSLTTVEHSNWYPLRRLSHLVDVSLFGMRPGAHHLMSALWHAGATAILFLALRLMTGALWRSVVVSGLFAVHPLQVESVAWASERSTVLAGFFFAATLLFWGRYARAPGVGRYAMVLVSGFLGLLAKPILMPLPILLLLLDVWPLGRVGSSGALPWRASWPCLRRCLLEKLPLFVFAAVTGGVAIKAHQQSGSFESTEVFPLSVRLGNMALSYWRYLGKLFWPADLAVYYPHAGSGLSLGLATAAGAGLIALTALILLQVKQRPWLAVGWFWYSGMLAPMSGIVQFGAHAMADRFVYLPAIGVFAIVVWFAAEELPPLVHRSAVLVLAAAATIAALAATTVVQEGRWRDSETLFRHTLALTSGNWLIHYDLGTTLGNAGRTEEAMGQYREALRARPDFAEAHYNLGNALADSGRTAEALFHYREAVRVRPDFASAYNNLGILLATSARYQEAVAAYQEALRLQPGFAEVHNNLGNALMLLGRGEEAAWHLSEAERLRGRR